MTFDKWWNSNRERWYGEYSLARAAWEFCESQTKKTAIAAERERLLAAVDSIHLELDDYTLWDEIWIFNKFREAIMQEADDE